MVSHFYSDLRRNARHNFYPTVPPPYAGSCRGCPVPARFRNRPIIAQHDGFVKALSARAPRLSRPSRPATHRRHEDTFVRQPRHEHDNFDRHVLLLEHPRQCYLHSPFPAPLFPHLDLRALGGERENQPHRAAHALTLQPGEVEMRRRDARPAAAPSPHMSDIFW